MDFDENVDLPNYQIGKLSLARALAELGYEPELSLATGIQSFGAQGMPLRGPPWRLHRDWVGGKIIDSVEVSLGKSRFDEDVPAFNIAELGKTLSQSFEGWVSRSSVKDCPDAKKALHGCLLQPRSATTRPTKARGAMPQAHGTRPCSQAHESAPRWLAPTDTRSSSSDSRCNKS